MNVENRKKRASSIAFGTKLIEFGIKRSRRKTLGITVRPDTTVAVTAPFGARIETVKNKVHKRARWILRQQEFFRNFIPRIPPRRYVAGETHRYLGRQYRLKIIKGANEGIKLNGRFLYAFVRKKTAKRVKPLVEDWYLSHANTVFHRSLAACLLRLRRHVQSVPILRLHHMRKRWGSCTKKGDIYLNPELVKASRSCIDYVMTHELCHLVHPRHNREFLSLLRKSLPDWEMRKAGLEQMIDG